MTGEKTSDKARLSLFIKEKAEELGFDACGIVKATHLAEIGEKLKHWINTGYYGNQHYFKRNEEKRLNPKKLVENTKSIVIVALNYYHENYTTHPDNPLKIARYAAIGKSYHKIIKGKLNKLLQLIATKVPAEGQPFVDSAPVLEKAWGQRAGIGWQGKNTLLINKKLGSYFFLGELFLDMELTYDEPFTKDLCRACTKCIDACPTQALIDGKFLDATKCISYYTVENKGNIPASLVGKFQNYIFGCDICQEVCPWNKPSRLKNSSEFTVKTDFLKMTKADWKNLSEKEFYEKFKDTELLRTGLARIQRNINFLEKR